MNVRDLARRIRRPLAGVRRSAARALGGDREYSERVASEKKHFHEDNTADQLPGIFHYWSNRYLRPKLESVGFSNPDDMFARQFERAYRASRVPQRRFLSIGSGRCDTELRLARHLVDRGCADFTFECVELNDALLAQAVAAAQRDGLGDRLVAVASDMNLWTPQGTYDGVLANSSLHHITNLEGVFEGIAASLAPTGTFVTSDTIGRNGHMRWPESLAIVHEFWRELPRAKTYNHALRRFEKTYDNWDCAFESFEGVRAQDILPLLLLHFDFDVFVAFANVIDPFIDRAFGPNFDAENAADCAFIDRVHRRDEQEIARGAIKPTHLVAAMCVGRPGENRLVDGLTPRFCVRAPAHAPRPFREATGDDASAGSGDEAAAAAGPAPAPPPVTGYTDLWWNPDQPGWGLSITHHASGRLVAMWHTYDAAGEPTWYSLQPGAWSDARTYAGPVYRYRRDPGDGGAVKPTLAGTATLAFDDSERGTFACELSDRPPFSTPIRRMEY